MEHEEIKSPVGKKATVIWKAYREVLEELKALEATPSTVETAKTKAIENAVELATELDVEQVAHNFDQFVAGMKQAKAHFLEVNEAIEAKKQELKDVHDLEVEVNSMVAVVQAKNNLVEAKEAEAKEIIAKAKEKAEETKKQAEDEAEKIKAEIESKKAEFEKLQKRMKEEWDYDFSRKKILDNNRLQDELDVKNREYEERLKDLETREALANDNDAIIKELEERVDNFETEKAESIEIAIEQALKKAKQSAAIEKAMIEKGHEAKLEIANATIEQQKSMLAELRARVDRAEEAVKAANDRVTNIATGALQAAADAKTVARVSEIAVGSGGQKK